VWQFFLEELLFSSEEKLKEGRMRKSKTKTEKESNRDDWFLAFLIYYLW
jgi:hypothetical protein